MKLTFIDYLIEAKSLNFNPEFVFANKQVFDADMAINPTSEEAQKIISKIQRPKIEALAQLLDVQWKMLFAKSFEQRDRWRGTSRIVWTYILVGNDPDGNEIAYYKYEAGPGSGQSHVYGNRRNKTKLTWILDSTSAQAREALGLVKHKAGGPIPTDENDLIKILKRRFKKSTIIHDDQDRLRLVIPYRNRYYTNKAFAMSFIFKKWGKKMKVNYDHLEGVKAVRRGFRLPSKETWLRRYDRAQPLGSYDDINEMIAGIRKILKVNK